MKWEDSKVFVLAETQIDIEGRRGYLEHLGVSGWTTDATCSSTLKCLLAINPFCIYALLLFSLILVKFLVTTQRIF
jgi:hypothetical protein